MAFGARRRIGTDASCCRHDKIINGKTKIEVCHSPALYPVYESKDSIVVVIDILRATSAICTAFEFGAEKIIPVATVEEAWTYKQNGFLAGAERDAVMVEGFDFGNSPFSYMDKKIKGSTIVLTTTNGTQAIEAAKKAHKVVIGAFTNFSSLCGYLISQNRDVLLLCAGWKDKYNLEDALFAGAVTIELAKNPVFDNGKIADSAWACRYLYEANIQNRFRFFKNASHSKRLAKLNLKKDIKYCFSLDKTKIIPVLEKGCLVKLA